jgi:hypothetical protein
MSDDAFWIVVQREGAEDLRVRESLLECLNSERVFHRTEKAQSQQHIQGG